MNKKRFKYEYGLIWNENGEKFDVNECEGRRLVCDKLNEQQATIDKQDKAIREALKVLADSKNYQSVISFKYGLQYATKLLKRVIDDE